MLRIKTNKTKLYKLVSEYETLPIMRLTDFLKVCGRQSYWLRWPPGPGSGNCWRCEAYLTVAGGHPKLIITKKDFDGRELSSVVRTLDINDLIGRGMVEEFVPVAERCWTKRR